MLSLRLSSELLRTTLVKRNLNVLRTLTTNQCQLQRSSSFVSEFEGKQWEPIFKLPFIKPIVALNKLKIYQGVFTLVAVPAAYFLPGYFDPMIIGAIGVTGTITLTIFSFLFRNTIGFIYTCREHPDLVRFAYLDIMGKRKDEVVELSTIKLLEELKVPIIKDAFCYVEFIDQKKKLKLSHTYGGIMNFDQFHQIFGNVE